MLDRQYVKYSNIKQYRMIEFIIYSLKLRFNHHGEWNGDVLVGGIPGSVFNENWPDPETEITFILSQLPK